MRWLSYAIEAGALAVLFILVLRKLKSERDCWAKFLADEETRLLRSLKDSAVLEIGPLDAEARGHRAMALMCASVVWRGDPTDTEGLLSVADEFLQYIQGDDSVMPRPDKAIKGKMPKLPKGPYGR